MVDRRKEQRFFIKQDFKGGNFLEIFPILRTATCMKVKRS
jgi:hypothetical protein